MKHLVAYSVMDDETSFLAEIRKHYNTVEVPEKQIGQDINVLTSAEVFLLGSANNSPVKEVQRIYAADKHISIIIFSTPAKLQQVKQSLQFAPFIGKNAIVVAVNAAINIIEICDAAINRTRQKRSFAKMNLQQSIQVVPEKVRPSQMGSFLEYAPIAAILISAHGKVANYNKAARKIFQAEQLEESNLFQLMPDSTAETLRKFLQTNNTAEATIDLQLQRRIFEVSSSKVFTEEGDEYILLLLNDVTDQRQETQRIHSILEALPQMAFTSNADGVVFYYNRGWYHYTGQNKTEALGWGWSIVVHPDDVVKLTELWKLSLDRGVPLQHAVRYKHNSGEYRWHLTRATNVRNVAGEIVMWVGTCTDIHDQVLLTEELERKVKERTITLEAANAELEQFAHVSSHDLQEPLRKIRTFSELLKDNAYHLLDDSSRRYLDKINTTAERMSNSLKALLNYTSMQRREKFIMVDLDDVVKHVLVDLELLIQQKNATIIKDQLPVINAAPVQMQQLFYNLINNALKFSKPEVPPVVTITSNNFEGSALVQKFPQLDHSTTYCEIIIRDNGIGFHQQYAEKIFSIFQRLHKKTEYEGTGIGLSLVKRVVHNHKGEVYAFSGEDEGAAFHILLPVDL